METRHNGSQCNDSRSLDVVVEASYLRPIFVQYSPGISQAKVLTVACEPCIRYSSVRMVLTSVDMRRGTTCVRTGQICQQIRHTLDHVYVVVEDQGKVHRSAIDGSGLRSATFHRLI